MILGLGVIGKVYASYRPLRVVEGLIVAGGRVVYAGCAKVVEDICEELGFDVVKAGVVVPGFIDAHVHLDGLGLSLSSLDLRGVNSIEELKALLKEYASRNPSGWIVGRGWDQELLGRWPTRWGLDEAVPDKPVLLIRVCGHAGVVNSKALELLGLLEKFSGDPCLEVVDGIPTGVVKERVLEYARSRVEEEGEVEEWIARAQDHLLSLGVTSVGFAGASLRDLASLFKLRLSGRLRVRVRAYLELEAFKALESLGLPGGLGDQWLRVQGVKVFADGSLGARTAWLSNDYADDPGNAGIPLLSSRDLEDIAKRCSDLGYQLAVHAIGDRALDAVLEAFKAIGPERVRELRFRIEHASVVRDDQLWSLTNSGAIAVVQPHFIITDWWIVKRLGEQRARWIYRFKTLIKHGVPLAFSTDAPVEPCNPWKTVYAAVTRGENEGVELSRHTKDEKLELAEALALYTEGSAYAIGADDLGKLEPGYWADMVFLDRDPFEASDPKELLEIKAKETYVGGVKVYPR